MTANIKRLKVFVLAGASVVLSGVPVLISRGAVAKPFLQVLVSWADSTEPRGV